MKKKKLNVAILFGGKSVEHQVSLLSAKNVIDAIDRKRFNPILIGIDKQGRWILRNHSNFLLNSESPKLVRLNKVGDFVALIPESKGKITNLSNIGKHKTIDVVFPVLHGTLGEDGTVQGLLKLADIPFVGASVLGSAVGMDKDISKRLLRDAGIPIAKYLAYKDVDTMNYEYIVKQLNLPFFVKPANLGSSVGISKVKSKKEFKKAISKAFEYDTKILIEEYIKGREIECSVLGNENPIASIAGEVIANDDFYTYEAKYINENGAVLNIPAKLDKKTQKKIQALAIRTFKILSCEGLGRVDFFLTENGDILVNEINTLPGFTSISMYPKLWEISGIKYTDLITKLIELALERYRKEQKLRTTSPTRSVAP